MPWIPIKVLEATLKFNDPYDLNLFGPVIEKGDNADAIIKVARWHNLQSLTPQMAKPIQSENLVFDIWQPWPS